MREIFIFKNLLKISNFSKIGFSKDDALSHKLFEVRISPNFLQRNIWNKREALRFLEEAKKTKNWKIMILTVRRSQVLDRF